MTRSTETQTYLALSGLDFEGYNVPAHTQGMLLRYIYNRYSPGSFGRAILAGNMEAGVSVKPFGKKTFVK